MWLLLSTLAFTFVIPLSFSKMIRGPFISSNHDLRYIREFWRQKIILIFLGRKPRHPKPPISASVHCCLVIVSDWCQVCLTPRGNDSETHRFVDYQRNHLLPR